MSVTLGVDVGGRSILCGVVDEGAIVKTTGADTGQSPQALVDSVMDAINSTLASARLTIRDVEGVGIGVPAFINPLTGLYRFPNIPNADKVDLDAMISSKLSSKFVIGNDADYCAYGAVDRLNEFAVLKGGCGSGSIVELVLITLGTGIGGGVIVKCGGIQKILSGARGLTEIGHMKVTDDPEYLCGCGAIGCVEATSSCTAIVEKVLRNLEDSPEEIRAAFPAGFDSRYVDDLSQKDNMMAEEVMESASKYLGIAVSNMLNAMNPNYFAFSGGGANSPKEGVFFSSLLEVVKEKTLPEAWEAVTLVKNPDAKRYGVLGASKAAL